MMNMMLFVTTFRDFYYRNRCPENVVKTIFPSGIKQVDEDVEEYIMNNKLIKGVFDKESFAWKIGTIESCLEGKLEFSNDSFSENNNSNVYSGNRIKVRKDQFEQYKKELAELLGNGMEDDPLFQANDDLEWDRDIEKYDKGIWKNEYIKIAGSVLKKRKDGSEFLAGFGPVNIINAMFFLSKGKAPIYDMFAHKAARALALDMNPAEIHMGLNPDKKEIDNVITMYMEYISLLKRLFPDSIGKDGMFIPRDLDRALWVYGHADSSKFMDEGIDWSVPHNC